MKKLIALFMALAMLTGCGNKPDDTDVIIDEQSGDPGIIDENTPPVEEEPENIKIRFTAVGDNLIHNTLSFDSKTDNGYDFNHIYAGIAGEIEGSDIAFVNQEVPLDGSVGAYPVLGAPTEVADALANIGFNAASLSNNHMADRGAQAIPLTIEALQNAGFDLIAGAGKKGERTYAIKEVNGVKIGLLAYTYGMNSGLGNSVWEIDRIGTENITRDVNAIRPECDFLAVSMHWGNEYQRTPSDGQREFANLLARLDVDLVIGSHPHVMQPAEWISREGKEDTLCIYSLGNFCSGQREQDRLIGSILKLELEFTPEGEFIGFSEAEVEGVITHYEMGNIDFRLYTVDNYSEELATRHGLHKYELPISYTFFKERIAGIKESLLR